MENPAIKSHSRPLVAVALLILCVCTSPATRAQDNSLHVFHSRHYTIHTNLNASETKPFAKHMDIVFDNYQKRFSSFHTSYRGPLQFYLLRTQKQYIQFLAHYGINGQNSGGMFFVNAKIHGLATWADGNSRRETFSTLQHEGFHQFAFYYIGHDLPPWVNEGIAQYFQDGIIVHGDLVLGLADERRLNEVKSAIKRNHIVHLSRLVNINGEQWGHILQQNPQTSSLLYAEAWDMVYFLINADHGKYRGAFVEYLHLVAMGVKSRDAFARSFGTQNFNIVEQRWLEFAAKQKPSPLADTVSHLSFLGSAMKYLTQKDQPIPQSIGSLKKLLQKHGFAMIYPSDGVAQKVSASDNNIYRYKLPNGTFANLKLVPPHSDGMPPSITAPGVKPQPTLTWSRDDRGDLAMNIEFN